MDELLNYRGRDRMALVASIPPSELEMTAEDRSDYERFKKLLDRLEKAVIMSAESETSEIIRRRLFEWDLRQVGSDGRVLLNYDAIAVCNGSSCALNEITYCKYKVKLTFCTKIVATINYL